MEIISKILFFFNKAQKKQLIAILALVVLMGLVEMMGVATIFPFMAVVVKPEFIYSNTYLQALFQSLSVSETNFMLFLGLVVFLVLVLGNLFSAFVSWIMMRFCYKQGSEVSSALFKKYLNQPYVFYLKRHSAELGRNVLSEVDRVVIGIFLNGMQAVAKFSMMICITSLLFMMKPWLALAVISLLGSAYLLIYTLLKRKLARAGVISSEVNGIRYQIIHEVMGAIKELKILGTENKFLETFRDCANRFAKAETLSQLSPIITKYTVEAIAFGGMLLIALYLIARKEEMSQFIPLLGLYALAGYRLMPAMQQIFNSFSLLKYHVSALNNLYQEIQLPSQLKEEVVSAPLPFNQCLKLNNITYLYEGTQRVTLKDISLVIPIHSTIGIVGPSGAGKTTVVDIILGLLTPSSGEMQCDEIPITKNNLRAWQKNVGYVPQSIFLIDASIAANIALGVPTHEIDQAAVARAARLANLHEFITEELPEGYRTTIGERGVRLSGGQRQRIGIARALYHDPELLVFDEATSALDGMTEKVIMEAIKSLAHRKTIIIIAHRLNTVRECDTIYLLSEGQLTGQGTYAHLLATDNIFQKLVNAN